MHTVKISREELLIRLKENLVKHRAIFEEALEGYRSKVISELTNRLHDAKANRRVNHSIKLTQPMDQTRDYDRAILMCELSAEPIIELTEMEFASYVMDDWQWKDQFLTSNSVYAASLRR